MLLSMTGHGEAQRQQDGLAVAVEVRTVNNRFLKVSLRTSEGLTALEPQIESIIRGCLRRGSVLANVRVDREPSADDYRLNETVLAGYWKQLETICEHIGSRESLRIEALLALPGVVAEQSAASANTDAIWPVIEATLLSALENLGEMRMDEGAAMAADLEANSEAINAALSEIGKRAPLVVDGYRQRLQDRLNKLLENLGVSVQESDIVREVGMFADRGDISEEIVRLRSHLEQFGTVLRGDKSNGRKLEFLIQELLRESNTIGSKANDTEISRLVVDIKTAIERMREMVQNVE